MSWLMSKAQHFYHSEVSRAVSRSQGCPAVALRVAVQGPRQGTTELLWKIGMLPGVLMSPVAV